MRLKWLPVRLKGRRRVSRVAVDSAPVRRPSTALHFCGGPANVSCPRPMRASWEGGSVRMRGELIARRHWRSGERLRRVCESFARRGAGLSRLGPCPSAGVRDLYCVQWRPTVPPPAGGSVAPSAAVVGARMAASDPS